MQPAPPGQCKVVLSTNIAESSITIPDAVYVIDSGLRRGIFVDERTGKPALMCRWASQASAKQRAGRTGRVAPGTALYLFRCAKVFVEGRASGPRALGQREDPCVGGLSRNSSQRTFCKHRVGFFSGHKHAKGPFGGLLVVNAAGRPIANDYRQPPGNVDSVRVKRCGLPATWHCVRGKSLILFFLV